MKKLQFSIVILMLTHCFAIGQQYQDSVALKIKQQLDTISFSDTTNQNIINQLLGQLKDRSSSGENIHASMFYYSKLANKDYFEGNYNNSGVYYDSAAYYAKRLKDTVYQFKMTMNAGALKYMVGDYSNALSRYLKAAELAEYATPEDLGGIYSNIGMLYNSVDMIDKAEEYMLLSLKSDEEYNEDSSSLVKSLNVLGLIARKKKNYEQSIELHKRAERIGLKSGAFLDVGDINHNLYEVYYRLGDKEKQLQHLERSIRYYDSSGFMDHVYAEKGELAKFYLDNDRFEEAGNELNEILKKYYDFDFEARWRQMIAEQFARYYKHKGDHKKAYRYLKRALAYKDSVHEKSRLNETANLELKMQMEKQNELDSIKRLEEIKQQALISQKKEAEHNAELSSQKLISTIGFGGGGFALIVALLLYRANRNKTRTNKIIRNQKSEIEEKQTEIIDSIRYAKRLQNAIMPEEDEFDKVFPSSFVFYVPKDIVAGDFYFLETVSDADVNRTYFAAVDCTGHGVPGAMLSVVGANGLKRCIRELQLRDPGLILDELSSIVAENFTSKKEKIRDGMDIALCCLETRGGTKRLLFSGAYNPAWILNAKRASWPDNVEPFKEGGGAMLRPNKQAIGYKEKDANFDTVTVELQKGDMIYLFSDGYADQFGGNKGKKMKSAAFRRYLNQIKGKDMREQHELLREHFYNWKGDYEQVDDVCVMGIKV